MPQFFHNEPVSDADQVEIRDAATVLIIADRPDLHVLMVERTSRAAFAPSAWVFPGGRVDRSDAIGANEHIVGLDDATASTILEVETNGLAWWVAAIRETLEEAGLLLGADGASGEVIDSIREAVHADPAALLGALAENGLHLDATALCEVGRFITPVGPPRRFDARFFIAVAPDGQTPQHDEEEVVKHMWIRPAEALERWRNDDFPMMSVTHRMLACLDRFETTAAAMAVANEQRPAQHVRVNDPDGAYNVVLPGEPGYETAEKEIEHGWVRF